MFIVVASMMELNASEMMPPRQAGMRIMECGTSKLQEPKSQGQLENRYPYLDLHNLQNHVSGLVRITMRSANIIVIRKPGSRKFLS